MICKNSVNEFYYHVVDKALDSFSTVFSSIFNLLIAHFFKYHSPICHVISLNTIQSYVSVCQFIVVYTVTYVYLIASMS